MKVEYKRLKECCTKIGSGATPKGGSSVYIDSGVSLIRSQNVYNLNFSYSGLAHINDDAAKKLKGVVVNKGDVLLNITGDSVARTCVVPDDVLPARVNQHVSIIRPLKDIDSRYLNYYLASPAMQGYLLNIASTGASRNAITKAMIEKLVIPFPDFESQRRIASILSAYDNLIVNNTRRIRLLEQMAENLYKEWFVRFRFPGHDNTEFENGLPKGWSLENLFNVADVSYGYAFKSDLFCNDNNLNAVVRIRDIQDNHTDTYTSEVCDDKYLIEENAILVGMDGLFHMCLWNGDKAYLNQRVVKICSKKKDMCNYMLFMAIQPQIKFWEQVIAGTTVAHLGDKHLKRIKIAVPTEDILLKANYSIQRIMVEKNQLFKQNQILSCQRDLLLPRLMSGKLEVNI